MVDWLVVGEQEIRSGGLVGMRVVDMRTVDVHTDHDMVVGVFVPSADGQAQGGREEGDRKLAKQAKAGAVQDNRGVKESASGRERKGRVRWKSDDRGEKEYWCSMRMICEKLWEEWVEEMKKNRSRKTEEIWRKFESTAKRCLEEGIGSKKGGVKKWSRVEKDEELERLRVEKKKLWWKVKKRKGNYEMNVELFRKVSKKMKSRVKWLWREKMRKAVEEFEKVEGKDEKRYWKKIKEMMRWNGEPGHRQEVGSMVNERGEEVKSKKEVLEVFEVAWRKLGVESRDSEKFDGEYAEMIRQQVRLMKMRKRESDRREEEVYVLNREIGIDEVVAAVDKLKKGKAAGEDGIINELFMYGGDEAVVAVWELVKVMWEREEVPRAWMRGVVVPFFKDGDRKDPGNYRGISLLSIVGKIYTMVLNERIMTFCEDEGVLAEEQGGFRKGRGCPDQLFSLLQVLDNRRRNKTYCCFIDVRKAYDRVFRAGLWKRLWDVSIRGKMWRVLVGLYDEVKSSVRVDDGLSEWFDVDVGVRQGCVLSPVLFSIFINGMVDEIHGLGLGVRVGDLEEKVSMLRRCTLMVR